MVHEIKQPYVLIVGLLLLLTGALLAYLIPDKGPLLLGVALATGMATKATVSMRMGAPNTAIGLWICAIVTIALVMVIVGIQEAGTLLMSSGREAALSGFGGLGIALLGEAQVRPRDE